MAFSVLFFYEYFPFHFIFPPKNVGRIILPDGISRFDVNVYVLAGTLVQVSVVRFVQNLPT